MSIEIKKVNLKLYDVLFTSWMLVKRGMLHLSMFQIMSILLNIGIVFVLGALGKVVGSWLETVDLIIIGVFNIAYFSGVWVYFSKGIERDKFVLDDLAAGFRKIKPLMMYALIMLLFFVPLIIYFLSVFPLEMFSNAEYFKNEEDIQVFAENFGNKILIMILLAGIINLFTFYAIPFIMIKGLSPYQAVLTSLKLVWTNFLKLFSLFFIIVFMGLFLVSVLGGIMGQNMYLMYLLQVIFFVFLQSLFYSLYYHTMLKIENQVE